MSELLWLRLLWYSDVAKRETGSVLFYVIWNPVNRFCVLSTVIAVSSYIIRIPGEKQQMSRLETKPTKWYVRPTKTQISLGIRPV